MFSFPQPPLKIIFIKPGGGPGRDIDLVHSRRQGGGPQPGIEPPEQFIITAAGFGYLAQVGLFGQDKFNLFRLPGRIQSLGGNSIPIPGRIAEDDFRRDHPQDILVGLIRQIQVIIVVDPLLGNGLLYPSFPAIVSRDGHGPVVKMR